MRCTIAIIDDDDICLLLHQKVIESFWDKAEIQTFNTAGKALDFMRIADKTIPLLLFLDINMPGISGWDLLKIIQQDDFALKVFVILVSSSVDTADKKRAQQFSKVIG